jgi:hypothetical protein
LNTMKHTPIVTIIAITICHIVFGFGFRFSFK